MQFSLIGDHPDGLEMARALAEVGRHTLATYTGPPDGADWLSRAGLGPKLVRDTEEVLADPSIEAVIVASPITSRPAHLRRAVQSERHVLCVCPVDQTPDVAYEAAMIQKDTGCILLPLLPWALHPAFTRLARCMQDPGLIGEFGLLQVELAQPSPPGGETGTPSEKVSLPGWEVLRALGGEIVEVSAFAEGTELQIGEPLLLSGRFERGGIFQVSFVPQESSSRCEFTATGSAGRVHLIFPEGFRGPAEMSFAQQTAGMCEELWQVWNPRPALVELFETALNEFSQRATSTTDGPPREPIRDAFPINWQVAVRCLELDDAARRSVERRRVSALDYQEASEEVGFKGTMTLVGCALLWFILLAVVLSRWVPWLGWIIVPILGLFLGLQLLRWILPKSNKRTQR
jgi:predicted dehydrogenase